LPFLRPELIAVSGPLMALRLARDWRAGQRQALRTLTYFALAALPGVLLYWVSTGTPLPSTIEAKRNFFAEGCRPSSYRLSALRLAFSAFRNNVGAFCYVALLLPLSVTGGVGLAFALAFTLSYYLVSPGMLAGYELRYMYVLVPWLVYAAAQLIALRHVIARALAALLFAACIWQTVDEAPFRWRYHLESIERTRGVLQPLAEWLTAHAQGTKILVHDAGYVGYAVEAPLADLVGLKSPASIPPHRELTWAECSRSARVRAIERIMLHERPHYLVLLDEWDRVFQISSQLRERGWGLERRYHNDYSVLEVKLPPAPLSASR
jgi:hypothetical protein